jgi:dephospho-CoA kinase
MIVVALTGGIGSGKSTVSRRLAERGAVVIDADAIARDLQRAGGPLLDGIAARFGPGVIGADGELDRPALAAIAFTDDRALADLNDIVHPAVRAEMARRIAAESGTDRVVVVDTPLLDVKPAGDFAAVIVVDTPVDVAVERLVAQRGMIESDARARVAKQVGREERLARADQVIDNSGDLSALDAQLDDLWEWLRALT